MCAGRTRSSTAQSWSGNAQAVIICHLGGWLPFRSHSCGRPALGSLAVLSGATGGTSLERLEFLPEAVLCTILTWFKELDGANWLNICGRFRKTGIPIRAVLYTTLTCFLEVDGAANRPLGALINGIRDFCEEFCCPPY